MSTTVDKPHLRTLESIKAQGDPDDRDCYPCYCGPLKDGTFWLCDYHEGFEDCAATT